MKPFSQNLEIQGPCCEVIISELGQSDSIVNHVQMAVKISTWGHIITLAPKFFSEGRISEFWSINPHFDVIIPILLKIHIDLQS